MPPVALTFVQSLGIFVSSSLLFFLYFCFVFVVVFLYEAEGGFLDIRDVFLMYVSSRHIIR